MHSVLKRYITGIWLLFLGAHYPSAQLPGYHVQKLTGKNGLVDVTQVDDMMRDSDGFLWLLTPTKVQRFDGNKLLSFTFEDHCIGIQQDADGVIWILSQQNIYRFKNDYSGFELLPEYRNTDNKYLSLRSGPGEKLYVLTTEGILRWNSNTGKMDPLINPSLKIKRGFNYLQFYGDCIFYALTDSILIRYNTVTKIQDSVYVQKPNYIIPVNTDHVWVRQGIGGSAMVSFKTKKIMPVNQAMVDGPVYGNNFFITAAFESRPGEFFVMVNDKGYYTYNLAANRFKKLNFFTNGRLLTGKPLLTRNSFFKENNGTVWFTNEEGIFYVNLHAGGIGLLRSSGSTLTRWDNDIRNLTEDTQGNIWFSTANGFCKWDKITGKVSAWLPDFAAADYLNYPSVKAIGHSNGKIIIGQSEKGFWIFDPGRQTFNRPVFESDRLQKSFESEFNRGMLQLKNGNFLVLSDGVWLINRETFKTTPVKTPEVAVTPRKALEDAQGRIWILGRKGITAMDKNFKTLYSLDDIVRGKWYNAIIQIDENTFWVAAKTLYELKVLPSMQLTIRPVFPELKTQHFSNFFRDSLQRIWMCADDGIYRYVPETKTVEKFDQSDNIQSFYTSVSNCFRGSNGMVYFGTLSGINYFIPEKIPLQQDSLQVHLLNVSVNNDDSSYLIGGQLQKFKYSQNTVAFDFISPYLYCVEKVRYRYRLEGIDHDWVNIGTNTSVRFNALRPGKYTFTVAATLNGKLWFAVRKPYTFIISPPFWKTWWFIVILLLIIASLTIMLLRRRIRFIKKREAEKTEIQKIKMESYKAQLETEQVINYFATSISGQTTVEEMLSDVAKNLIGKMGFEDCMIYLWNPGKNILVQKAGYGIKGSIQSEPDKTRYNIPRGKGIVGAAAESKQSILVNDTSKNSLYFTVDGKIRLSELCVPILHNNETLGVINTEHTEKDFYTPHHLHVLTTIASLCADKIDTIRAEQQAREKELEVLKLNKDLAISQLTALRAQMNPHFIFNALNSVQQYILQGNVIEANRYLSKFSKLQREILNYSSQNFILLQQELETLQLYLELEQLRFGENFRFTITKDDIMDEEEIKIPPMIIQPFIENAIWHGLMPKTGDRYVHINFRLQSDDLLVCTVTDNGIGREAAGRLRQAKGNESTHKSKGLSLVYDRLNILQVLYGKPFSASITDLVNHEGASAGTQVVLTIYLDF